MKKNLFWKMFGGHALLVVLFAAALILSAFKIVRKAYVDDQAGHLTRLASIIEPEIRPMMDRENGKSELTDLVVGLKARLGVRITVIDASGAVLADSEEVPDKMDSHQYRPEVFETIKGGRPARSLRRSSTTHASMLYMGFPIGEDPGKSKGVLRLSIFMSEIDHLLSHLFRRVLLISALIMGLVFLMMLAFSRSLSSPIREFAATSRNVAKGNFKARVSVRSGGEIGEFAKSFNSMAESLDTLFESAREKEEELNGILASIQEGLIVIDKDDRIVLGNGSFRDLFPEEDVSGRVYWEIVRGSKFHDLVRRVKISRSGAVEEIPLKDRIFICRASFLAAKERVVVTFQDLSEIRNVERMKKDLVLNVSHELRTPLASIKGFVETLESESGGKDKNAIGIIRRNTDRMIAIVQDLMTLAEIEEKGSGIITSEVDVRELVENVFRLFADKAASRSVRLELRSGGEVPPIKGDAYQLEQMLVNLVDNAVKATEKGNVVVSLGGSDREIVIEIEDTGIGIDESDIPHLFERFYVVDKSRSRKLGGTGLGLSIVKHIVLAHRGRISVKSRIGKGTVFTISLPVEG